MAVASFDSVQPSLKSLLDNVATGRMQLPDFQRGWVWDDEHIKSLIASVSLSFPIGALMTLDTGSADVTFKPRPIEGTNSLEQVEPETLILDGQQRLTSLFQSLRSGRAVETRDAKGKMVKRWYYLDMNKCVDDTIDREEAVVSIPEERLVRRNFSREIELDLSSPEREYENEMFPVDRLFDSDRWLRGYIEHWNLNPDKWSLFQQFNDKVIDGFKPYQVPVIKLGKETPKEAVCLVFEKVNTGGVTLTVFELLTASFAAYNFQLREDWDAREKRLKTGYTVLKNLQSDAFLQTLTLLVTKARPDRALGCKRRDILRLSVEDYIKWADKVENGFIKAARFMHGQKVFGARDLPYQTQLVPLAAILADLGDAGDTEGARQKIARWYWCGVFGEVYGGPTETLFARDLPEVTGWVRDQSADEPTTIRDANFQASRLLTLRTRNSAAYKGVHALLMRDGSRDFRTGEPIEAQTFFDDSIDIHHVFPRAWCRRQQIESTVFDSIVNKTAIASNTNRRIGGRAPATYLRGLQRDADISAEQLDGILASHRIPAARLRANDFRGFFAARGEALCEAIEAAMGKTVVREEGVFLLGAPVEDYDDGPTDWEEEATLGASVA